MSQTDNMHIKMVSPAKLNLFLQILDRRPDQYHDIETVFQTIDLADQLTFELSPSKKLGVELIINNGDKSIDFPLDNKNLIWQAINLYFQNQPGLSPLSIKVSVTKRIPSQAGLAGGSSNAASTLIALNEYYRDIYTYEQLHMLARDLGADVPFFLVGGIAVGQGRGEILTSIVSHHKVSTHFLLVKPRNIAISTAWAYYHYARDKRDHHESKTLATLRKKLNDSSLQETFPLWKNAFEPMIFGQYPELSNLKQNLLDLGCLSVNLTGKGPTLFGLVQNQDQGKSILNQLTNCGHNRNQMNKVRETQIEYDTFLTQTIFTGIEVKEIVKG